MSGGISTRSLLHAKLFVVVSDIRHRGYTRASIPSDSQKMDIFDHGYVAKIWFYIFCGLLDAMWQTTAYWIMGAMSNDPAKLAHFTGFCKCLVLIAVCIMPH